MKSLIILAIVASVGLVAGVPGPNLALNKPTWQISTHVDDVDGVVQTAARAVDGDANPDMHAAHTCSHTNLTDNPWWVVDLGWRYHVTSVTITNRDCCDCCASRLRDFNIALMSSPPDVVIPSPDTYNIIYHHPGPMASGATVNYTSNDDSISGQYLVIQTMATDNYLTLCEVEVFGDADVLTQYTAFEGKACIGNGAWGRTDGEPLEKCASDCSQIDECVAFVYWSSGACFKKAVCDDTIGDYALATMYIKDAKP